MDILLDSSVIMAVVINEENKSNEDKIIITNPPMQKKETLECLFKDYSGESFTTTLTNPIEPVGNEAW